jgi:hypothetical protein
LGVKSDRGVLGNGKSLGRETPCILLSAFSPPRKARCSVGDSAPRRVKIIGEANDAAIFFALQTNAPAQGMVLVAESYQVTIETRPLLKKAAMQSQFRRRPRVASSAARDGLPPAGPCDQDEPERVHEESHSEMNIIAAPWRQHLDLPSNL